MIVFLLSDSDETDDDAFLFPHFDFGSPIFFKITPTWNYSIKVTEKTPYIRYDHNLYSNDNFLLEEVQNSANLNLVPLDIEHPSLSPNASTSFEFRL